MAESSIPFSNLLKDWRHHRHLSQLELAGISGISQRHISFLETGRSNPSRQMVVALCDSLDVPLRERNTLLTGAGFAPMYREESLDHESLAFFESTLRTVIDHHEPYPAVVLDGRWNVSMANEAALRFFSLFVDPMKTFGTNEVSNFQILRLCIDEDGLKPYIENWQELLNSLLQRARRAHSFNPEDDKLVAIIEEIMSHRDAPESWRQPDLAAPIAPVVRLNMAKDGKRFALFTMLAHFGTAEHVTLEELSVETFYPADESTKAWLENARAH